MLEENLIKRENFTINSFLNEAMFLETNPIPVKVALSIMGKIPNEFRLPLCPMSAGNLEKLTTALKEYGLAS